MKVEVRPMWELFGSELRRARDSAGLSQEALGDAVQYSGSQVAMVETCRRIPTPGFTTRCDEKLETGGLLARIRDAILKMGHAPWFREWPTLEAEAASIRNFEPLVIPGLLQTEDYARKLTMAHPAATGYDPEQWIAIRMARQAILTKENPVQFYAVIDERALHRPIGDRKVMYEQLMRLLELCNRPNVHIHVVPESAGAYAGLEGSFAIATMPDGRDVGYHDHPLGGLLIERAQDVQMLRHLWECVRAEALPRDQSIELIGRIAASWS